MNRKVYLDHNASTPVHPEVVQAMLPYFSERFGKVQIYAPFSHDSAVVLIQAILRAGSAEPTKYLPELVKTQVDGVIGPIAFDDKGDLKGGPVTLYQVKGGQWEPVETIGGPGAK